MTAEKAEDKYSLRVILKKLAQEMTYFMTISVNRLQIVYPAQYLDYTGPAVSHFDWLILFKGPLR